MDRERPVSEDDLGAILRIALGHASKERFSEALSICDWLIEEAATSVAGLRQRATVKDMMGETAGAISDLQRAISAGAFEPADFHTLGILLLKNGDTSAAVENFSRAIEIGTAAQNNYYTNSSLLFRAEALLKLTHYEDALNDATRLPMNYGTYISGSGMRTKEQISAEATLALERKSKNQFRFKPK